MKGKEQSVIMTGENFFNHLSDYQLLLNRVLWNCVSYILKHLKEIQDTTYLSRTLLCVFVMACEESHVDNTHLQYRNQKITLTKIQIIIYNSRQISNSQIFRHRNAVLRDSIRTNEHKSNTPNWVTQRHH